MICVLGVQGCAAGLRIASPGTLAMRINELFETGFEVLRGIKRRHPV